MGKRSKEMALKAYPVHSVLIQPARRGGYYADGHLRDGFIKGYEQAEKDTIDKGMNVLREQIEDLFYSRLTIGDFLKQFRKTMEEE